MERYFEKFGSNFIVSAFVPSLTFITVSVILFAPLIPAATATWFQIPPLAEHFPVLGVIILMFGILLSFTLTSLNTFLLKVWEGYVFFRRFSFLVEREKRKARRQYRQMERAEKDAKRLEQCIGSAQSDNVRNRYIRLWIEQTRKQAALTAMYQQSYAANPNDVLPTPFGNVLKAAEYYPADRYGIDSITLWPRMIHVIDKEYLELIDESRNELSFLVNCSLLCLVFGLLSIPASVYVKTIHREDQLFIYITAGAVAFVASYVFHRASMFSVGQYGDMIRAAYDLFRKKLFRALGYAAPETLEEEKGRWVSICEFLKAGERVHPMALEYEPSSTPEPEPRLVIPVERIGLRRRSRRPR